MRASARRQLVAGKPAASNRPDDWQQQPARAVAKMPAREPRVPHHPTGI